MVFFCIFSLSSCIEKPDIKEVNIIYKEGKAVAVSFSSGEAINEYNVYVNGADDTPVLGEFKATGTKIVFTPVIPFSKGQGYEIKRSNELIVDFQVLEDETTEQPRVFAIYPSTDTVPENLLKIYLVFSKPMQEVKAALDFIEVYNVTDAQETEVFLSLENELWNAEHTELTLWLDPGRIKTDLIPNRTKGLPIQEGKTYRIQIKDKWKDAEGRPLKESYQKIYHAVERDRKKPDPKQWELELPKKATRDTLYVDFKEPLDAMLVLETLEFRNADDLVIAGTSQLLKDEQLVAFYPAYAWAEGSYTLTIASKLEDLAGNNINHLFDRDLKSLETIEKKAFVTKDFQIQ